jgi:hypothetical protein
MSYDDEDHTKLVDAPAPELAEWVAEQRRQWQESETSLRKAHEQFAPIVLRARATFLAAIPAIAPDVLDLLGQVLEAGDKVFRYDLADFRISMQRMRQVSPEAADAFAKWLKDHRLDSSSDEWMARVALQTLVYWHREQRTGHFQYWNEALDPVTSLDAQQDRAEGLRQEPLRLVFTTVWRTDIELASDFRQKALNEFGRTLDTHMRFIDSLTVLSQPDESSARATPAQRDELRNPHDHKLKQQAEWLVRRHFLRKTFDKIAFEAATDELIDPDNIRKRVRAYNNLIGLVKDKL